MVTIRERYASGGVTVEALAKDYPIGKQQVSRILRGDRWASAGGPLVKNRGRLSPELAKEIRELYSGAEKPSIALLAEVFEAEKYTITRILNGTSYPDAGGPIRE